MECPWPSKRPGQSTQQQKSYRGAKKSEKNQRKRDKTYKKTPKKKNAVKFRWTTRKAGPLTEKNLHRRRGER